MLNLCCLERLAKAKKPILYISVFALACFKYLYVAIRETSLWHNSITQSFTLSIQKHFYIIFSKRCFSIFFKRKQFFFSYELIPKQKTKGKITVFLTTNNKKLWMWTHLDIKPNSCFISRLAFGPLASTAGCTFLQRTSFSGLLKNSNMLRFYFQIWI